MSPLLTISQFLNPKPVTNEDEKLIYLPVYRETAVFEIEEPLQ